MKVDNLLLTERTVDQPQQQIIRTPKCGYRGQLGTSTAVLYTAPSDTTPVGSSQGALLKSLIICNTDTVTRTFSIRVVESGGSVATNRSIFELASIAANTTYHYTFQDEEFPLDSGETINGLASAATVVTVRINVVELTA